MTKIVVSLDNKEQLYNCLKKAIDGVIVYLDKLAVNSCFFMSVEEIIEFDFKDKYLFVCMNKIMHNKDLDLVRETLGKLKDIECKILFYDMAVYNIAKELGIVNKLIIYQDHLNMSSYSNNFYYDMGIMGSYIGSDITGDELLNIRKNYQGIMMFTAYGYIPIFYSRRYLITNYLKYINYEKKDGNYLIKSDNGEFYPIVEESEGTTVYSSQAVNLINKMEDLMEIDYLVLNGYMINDIKFDEMIDKFINREHIDDCYLGFYNTKTIYRVKGE